MSIMESGNYCSSTSYESYATSIGERIPLVTAWIVGLVITGVTNAVITFLLPKIPNIFGTNGRLCLLSLAVNDLFGGLACFGIRTIHEIDQSLLLTNRRMCVAGSAVCTTFIAQSNLLLLVVTIDRYVTIAHPLHYPTLLTSARTKAMIVLGYVTGFLLSLARALHAYAADGCDFDPGACTYYRQPLTVLHLIPVFIFGSIMACLNIKILTVAKRHCRQIAHMRFQNNDPAPSSPPPRVNRTKDRASMTVALVVGSYYAVWTPYTVGSLVVSFTHRPIPQWCNVLFINIAFCHHFTNAIIYFIMHRTFRKSVMRLLCNRRTEPISEMTMSAVDGHVHLDNHPPLDSVLHH